MLRKFRRSVPGIQDPSACQLHPEQDAGPCKKHMLSTKNPNLSFCHETYFDKSISFSCIACTSLNGVLIKISGKSDVSIVNAILRLANVFTKLLTRLWCLCLVRCCSFGHQIDLELQTSTDLVQFAVDLIIYPSLSIHSHTVLNISKFPHTCCANSLVGAMIRAR